MRIPESPPNLVDLLQQHVDKIGDLISYHQSLNTQQSYWHWEQIKRLTPPSPWTHQQWWLGIKFIRLSSRKPIPLQDLKKQPFYFSLPDPLSQWLHEIDLKLGGTLASSEPILNPHTRDSDRDRYLIRSLMEEAITSSQLEGAVTTSQVAKEMLRTNRSPQDVSERMILNNYHAMHRIRELRDQPLTPELIIELQHLVTQNTCNEEDWSGRLRFPHEPIRVTDHNGQILHHHPLAEELPQRLQAMCDFANGKTPDFFIHPVIRSCLLHFWLAYDHPFIDGNGRTARTLFYWSMLHYNYWLAEFVSISLLIQKTRNQYAQAFLYTETDDNDLTYFLIYHLKILQKSILNLQEYVNRKVQETQQLQSRIKAMDHFNHRQCALLNHALKHPDARYNITSHRHSHQVTYQTARTDLLELHHHQLLQMHKPRRELIFTPASNLLQRLTHFSPNPASQQPNHS